MVTRAACFDKDSITATFDPEAIRRARVYTPLLRDENLSLVMRELDRILQERFD